MFKKIGDGSRSASMPVEPRAGSAATKAERKTHTFPSAGGGLPSSRAPSQSVTNRPTQWNGVIVRTKPGDSKAFAAQVDKALDMIASRPEGRRLLEDIAQPDSGPPQQFGYKVCIQPAASTKTTGLLSRKRDYTGTNVTLATSDVRASTPGQGAASAIRWNPDQETTPDGKRPAWVGLAHELIHAQRNLNGQSKLTSASANGGSPKALDEKEVVGLDGHGGNGVTENKIRREHGIDPRTKYGGLEDD